MQYHRSYSAPVRRETSERAKASSGLVRALISMRRTLPSSPAQRCTEASGASTSLSSGPPVSRIPRTINSVVDEGAVAGVVCALFSRGTASGSGWPGCRFSGSARRRPTRAPLPSSSAGHSPVIFHVGWSFARPVTNTSDLSTVRVFLNQLPITTTGWPSSVAGT